MIPTPRLRFIVRTMDYDGKAVPVRILQQWHTYTIGYPTEKGEWKDVPLEKEE